jgi:hypothetical protein
VNFIDRFPKSYNFFFNPSSGSGRTDGRDEANNRFPQFCERAIEQKKVINMANERKIG